MVLDVEDFKVGGVGDMEDRDRIRAHLGENLYQKLLSNNVRPRSEIILPSFVYFFRQSSTPKLTHYCRVVGEVLKKKKSIFSCQRALGLIGHGFLKTFIVFYPTL
jgi:hypothetical protein